MPLHKSQINQRFSSDNADLLFQFGFTAIFTE
jgi:hypothetical protein